MNNLPAIDGGTGPLPSGKEGGANILLVDDQTANLDALEITLESLGCRLVRAQTADEALIALLKMDFAAIVLDIKMPDINGIELAKLIKERKRTRHIPILFLTAHLVDDNDVLSGYGVGAVDYLSKPINPEILKSKIGVFVQLFRQTRALAVANQALEAEVVERERAEEALRRVNEELEKRVQQRTEDLVRANDSLREADERKNEFLATLAHELRNPLAPLRNALQVLRIAGANREASEQARGMMERQLNQLVRLVDDLLDVSRIACGRIELRREQVELSLVVQSAVEAIQPIMEMAKHELTVTLPPEPIVLDADLTRLAQVFSNLLHNAAKYSEQAGRVNLVAERDDGHVVVKIQDTGIGIAKEVLPKIFDLFMQADRRLERTQGGLGIGLAICRRLIEMHGGTIEAHSEGLGKGSEFAIRLPVVNLIADVTRPAASPCERPSPGRQFRIVVADDNPDAADSLARLLELEGNDVLVARDGAEALTAAESFRPEVVILDIGMPKLNGYDVANRIREQSWGKAVLLIALTGWGQAEDRRRSSEAGFDHHLVKPVDPGTLLDLLVTAQRPG